MQFSGSFAGPLQSTLPNNFSSPPNHFNTNFNPFQRAQEAHVQNGQQANLDFKDFAAWLQFQKAHEATIPSQHSVQQNYFTKGHYTQPTVNFPYKYSSTKKATTSHPKPVMNPPEPKRFQDELKGQFFNSVCSPNSESIEEEFLDVRGDDGEL